MPFYGSLSHGLDKQVTVKALQSADLMSFIPRTTVPAGTVARRLRRQRARLADRHPVQLRVPGLGSHPARGRGRPDARHDDEGGRQHLLHVQRA